MNEWTKLRREARERGEKFFETGRPCKYGHVCKRYASTGGCIECVTYRCPKPPAPLQMRFGVELFVALNFTEDDKIALETYLFEAANGFCNHLGKPMPVNNVEYKIQWAKEQKRRPSECPL